LVLEQLAQAEVTSWTALLDTPRPIVEDAIFHRLLNTFVKLGPEDDQFRFGAGGRTLSRHRARKTNIEELNRLIATIPAEYAKRPCVSLVSDAGTIERRVFLDLMVFAPYSRLRPFSFDSLEKERLTVDDYARLAAQAREEFKRKGVKVRSNAGDN
jgi:hypothetical protein